VPEFVQVLGAEEAGELLGIEQPAPGYWFPRSGWLHPGAVCRALANQPGIHTLENCGEIELSTNTAGWRATDPAGRHWDAPCVVIATGNASSGVAGLDWLPLRAIRGQTTLLPATGDTSKLRAALCHEGYIAPARVGEHCIGATFDLDDRDTTLRPQDHTSNLESLARAVPAWQEGLQQQDPSVLGGRVGFRCASPDYLPLAGPVPDRQAFLRRFAGLRRNARRDIPLPGDYLPGLFLSTGHGSRGLTSTPLAAELLASQICREPPPLSRDLIRALAPARFIIRDLSRNRI
jgi:tRNA 5-methylaminomethyl-2-thiouridine biosynthesis bifunctional protein